MPSPRFVPLYLSGARRLSMVLLGTIPLGMILGLTACVEAPPPETPPATARTPPPEPTRPPVTTQVFVYPTSGQSAERLSRDRYECYLWGVKQSGFDPSQTSLAPHQRVEVVPMPAPGTDVVAGAV